MGEMFKGMALYEDCVRDWDAANEERTSVAKAKIKASRSAEGSVRRERRKVVMVWRRGMIE